VCVFGDGAANQGTFGESLNFAALWKLPVVFMVTNNRFGMGTSLERHSAVTDLHKRGEGFGVPGMQCDGMDVADTAATMREAIERVREQRRPVLVEALTYRFAGHSMADPEQYRKKADVEEMRKRDPITTFAARLVEEEILDGDEEREALDEEIGKLIDEAVAFADASDFPPPESLYDHVYADEDALRGWLSVDERGARAAAGQDREAMGSGERASGEAYDGAQDGEAPEGAA
jgi:pyruvate dehydrogenase E1 component alpha subunit